MAELNIAIPTVRPGSTTEEQVRQLYRYAAQLNERLRYILAHLDVESFGEETAAVIRNAASAAETGRQNAESIQSLKAEFVKNAETVDKQIESITRTMNGTVRYSDDEWALVEQSAARFTADSYGFAVKTDVVDYLNRVLGGRDGAGNPADLGETAVYPNEPVYRYSGLIQAGYSNEEGAVCLQIKGQDSGDTVPLCSVHTPDKVKFKKGSDTVAHFGAEDMYIKDVRSHTLRFRGAYNSRFFSFVAKDDPEDAENGELLLQYGEYRASDFESNLQN